MFEATIATISKMIESLPESQQELVVEHIRDFIEDLRDELHWTRQFDNTHEQLIAAARKARRQMAKKHTKPMNAAKL